MTWIRSGDTVSIANFAGVLENIGYETGTLFVRSEDKLIESEGEILIVRRNAEQYGCIVIATTTLSSGVHLPAVRYVVSVDLPASIGDLVQVSNRAGRDSKKAMSITYFSVTALNIHWKRISNQVNQCTDIPTAILLDRLASDLIDLTELVSNISRCAITKIHIIWSP